MDNKKICTYSKQPLCFQCKGAVYKCESSKNIQCKKTFCGECKYTSNIKYSKNAQPICPRNLQR